MEMQKGRQRGHLEGGVLPHTVADSLQSDFESAGQMQSEPEVPIGFRRRIHGLYIQSLAQQWFHGRFYVKARFKIKQKQTLKSQSQTFRK